MQRACAAALLAGGETLIHNPGHSNDDIGGAWPYHGRWGRRRTVLGEDAIIE